MKLFSTNEKIRFHHPVAFWLGSAAVLAGVLAHLPMFLEAAPMQYRLAGMPMSLAMSVGMWAIVIGTLMTAYGLFPNHPIRRQRQIAQHVSDYVNALDSTHLTPAHWKLFGVLTFALIVDVMKPATLGFVIPGATHEYGLSKAQAALMPFAGILGTTIGSLLWGYLGDTIGRRASILLAAIIFIGSAICGAMPTYSWNVFMCFMMGLGAGGMLPITFALLAELTPRHHRGWLMVLIGGIGTVGGYLAASGMATLLEPIFGWRILWFIGAPTGIVLIILNRYIPESPRWLLAQGKTAEAARVTNTFCVTFQSDVPNGDIGVEALSGSAAGAAHPTTKSGNFTELFNQRFIALSGSLGLYALAWGLINFGFLLWLPMNLRALGMGVEASDAILAKSALIALPSVAIAAWLYHSWSTKKCLVLFALITSLALLGIATQGQTMAQHEAQLMFVLVALIASSSGMIAMLSPYSAEVYPSHIRATGSGWSAGCSKGIGVVTLGAVVTVGFVPGIATSAMIVAVPTLISAIVIAWKGVETRGLSLEAIQEAAA